jgi:hypothetical protein
MNVNKLGVGTNTKVTFKVLLWSFCLQSHKYEMGGNVWRRK